MLNKKSGKIISVILAVLIIFASLPTFSVFAETEGLFYYTVSDGKATITRLVDTNTSGAIEIPNTIGGYSVTSIGDIAFENCRGLTSITIPESVTSIGHSTFSDTAWFNNQPDGLVYAGKVVYRYKGTCPSNVTIKEGTVGIAAGAFENCRGLTSITIPDSVTSIGWCAFYNCTGLTSVTIGNSVTSIGNQAFACCTGLTSITIPDGVTSIGRSAFEYCAGLNTANISDISAWCNIEFNNSFSNPLSNAHNLYINNELITDLIIPDSVTSIGSYAFCGCTGLTSITIPDSVTSIGNSAFSGCTGLTSITIPNNITSIGSYAFSGCTGITSVTIPETVTEIGSGAFPKSTVIYGYPSTAAETFANSNGNVFVPLPDMIDVFFVKKANYFIGAKMEPNSVIIAAYFLSGEVKFYYKNFTVSGFDTETAGRKTVTVSYYGKTATFSINVFEPTSDDLTTAIDMILGKEGINEKYDYNSDGNVNILDLIALKKQLANMV